MRIPLYIKLMVSYLVVVGLVLLPTAVYLRTSLSKDLHAHARLELEQELTGVCARLGEASPAELPARTALLLAALPTRLTVIDTAGNVIGDSARPGVRAENHADRPEIRDALRAGTGTSLRLSRTTGQVMLYVAMRFPRAGAARGVARLSRPEATIDTARDSVGQVLRSTAAVALSAAVLLSLVAALAASRPLRRIAQGARSLAAGDFGAVTDVRTNDEIGEVAEALDALASQLRDKLLTAGVDRATLQALLDDIPVGVVLYDAHRKPIAINGAARSLCDLAPFAEHERAAELPRLDRQGSAVERCMKDGFTEEVPLALPWKPGAELVARWVAVFSPEGHRLPALVVLDRSALREIDSLRGTVRTLVAHLRATVGDIEEPERAAAVTRELLAAEERIPPPDLRAAAIEPHSVKALLESALEDVAPITAALGASFDTSLSEQDARVVDADGRARRALRVLLRWALDDPKRSEAVQVTLSSQDRGVRVSVRASRAAAESVPDVSPLVQALGGESGVRAHDEGVDGWILLPRA